MVAAVRNSLYDSQDEDQCHQELADLGSRYARKKECIRKAPDEMHTQKHGSAYPAEDCKKRLDWC